MEQPQTSNVPADITTRPLARLPQPGLACATEHLVVLRYFGPEVNPDAPGIKYKGDVTL